MIRRKLLILIESCDRSEAALISALPEAGYDVYLVCPPSVAGSPGLSSSAIKIYKRDFKSRFDLSSAMFVRNLIKAHGIDCVYAPRNNTLGIGVLASIGMSNKLVGYRGTTHHLRWYDPASLITYLNPRVDRIVCVSDAVKSFLSGMGVPTHRLIRIYKGHDIRWYSDLVKPTKAELGISSDDFTVCFTGNIRPVKGCDILLEALKMIPRDKHVMAVFVGECRDPKVTSMMQSVEIKDRIKFLGFRKDAAAISGMCDVFVMPSLKREGLPRAVIEAMAQGVPAIVSRVGGMPELVEDGKSGMIVTPGDPKALADAVMKMQADPAFRKQCSANARIRIERDFNITKTIEQFSAMFLDVTGSKS